MANNSAADSTVTVACTDILCFRGHHRCQNYVEGALAGILTCFKMDHLHSWRNASGFRQLATNADEEPSYLDCYDCCHASDSCNCPCVSSFLLELSPFGRTDHCSRLYLLRSVD